MVSNLQLSTCIISDAQVQSVVEEVQNIIGQVRDLGQQTREVGDKVRGLERNDTNDKFGVELAETISRVEAVRYDNTAYFFLH